MSRTNEQVICATTSVRQVVRTARPRVPPAQALMEHRSERHRVERRRRHDPTSTPASIPRANVIPAAAPSMPSCAVPGSARRSRRQHPRGQCQRARGASGPDQQAFDEQLTDDIESARAEGQPCAHLVEAGAGTRQRDRGEIADADDEHGQRGAPEEREWAPHVADERVLERFDAGEEPRRAERSIAAAAACAPGSPRPAL